MLHCKKDKYHLNLETYFYANPLRLECISISVQDAAGRLVHLVDTYSKGSITLDLTTWKTHTHGASFFAYSWIQRTNFLILGVVYFCKSINGLSSRQTPPWMNYRDVSCLSSYWINSGFSPILYLKETTSSYLSFGRKRHCSYRSYSTTPSALIFEYLETAQSPHPLRHWRLLHYVLSHFLHSKCYIHLHAKAIESHGKHWKSPSSFRQSLPDLTEHPPGITMSVCSVCTTCNLCTYIL